MGSIRHSGSALRLGLGLHIRLKEQVMKAALSSLVETNPRKLKKIGGNRGNVLHSWEQEYLIECLLN